MTLEADAVEDAVVAPARKSEIQGGSQARGECTTQLHLTRFLGKALAYLRTDRCIDSLLCHVKVTTAPDQLMPIFALIPAVLLALLMYRHYQRCIFAGFAPVILVASRIRPRHHRPLHHPNPSNMLFSLALHTLHIAWYRIS